MKRKHTGETIITSVAGENVQAFVPYPLPPSPSIRWSAELLEKHQSANIALGRLDSMTTFLPDPHLLLYSYVRKEAVLSSQIEGTQSSLSDLLSFENKEARGFPEDTDVIEVSNYVAAMEHGLSRLKEGFPLCLRLLREIHEVLLSRGRGNTKQPGEFRTSQNWIGGSRPGNAIHVPPPAHTLMQTLGDLEKFLNNDPIKTPTLEKAALAHVQFETIHPFLDGNGRVGRLLITLLLCREGVLAEPLLYLSLYFKKHRQYYYTLLQKIRANGDWESWLDFFFEGVYETSNNAVSVAKKLFAIFNEDLTLLKQQKRMAMSVLEVFQFFQKRPVCSTKTLVKNLHLTNATLNKALEHLQKNKIINEITGRKRDRLFSYTKSLQILSEDT